MKEKEGDIPVTSYQLPITSKIFQIFTQLPFVLFVSFVVKNPSRLKSQASSLLKMNKQSQFSKPGIAVRDFQKRISNHSPETDTQKTKPNKPNFSAKSACRAVALCEGRWSLWQKTKKTKRTQFPTPRIAVSIYIK